MHSTRLLTVSLLEGGGVYFQSGVGVHPSATEIDAAPCGQTDACENITFPQLRLPAAITFYAPFQIKKKMAVFDNIIDFMFLSPSLLSFSVGHFIHIRDYDFQQFLNVCVEIENKLNKNGFQ